MATAQQKPGTVIERDDLTLLDTRGMDWEDYPGLAGARIKVLSRYESGEESGEPNVFLLWMPPGAPFADLPHRHYHANIREYAFVLSGENPHWEYATADEQLGDCVVFRDGLYMDRLPGSIHGIEAGPTSETGFMFLFWREGGTGNYIHEPNAQAETIEVPYAADRQQPAETRYARTGEDGVVIDRPDLRILDTREMKWESFPGLDHCKIKVLTRSVDGDPMVFLLWFPPIELLPDIPHRHIHQSVTEWSYVLAGELPHWEYANAEQTKGDRILFKQGYYMHRKPGSIHGLEENSASAVGCLILSWRDKVGNFAAEPGFAEESPSVPY